MLISNKWTRDLIGKGITLFFLKFEIKIINTLSLRHLNWQSENRKYRVRNGRRTQRSPSGVVKPYWVNETFFGIGYEITFMASWNLLYQ